MAQKSLKKNAFYSVLKVFLSLVFPLITFPYASRILLPEGIGKVNFANSIINYFVMIASLGIGNYATREASKIRDDKHALTKFFKEIISINIVCCIIAYVLFFIALLVIPKFSEYRNLLLVCSSNILFSILGIEWIFTANEEFKFITLRSFFIQIFSLIYLFIFVRTKEDILHYAVFSIFKSAGSNILNFFFVWKYIDITYRIKLEIKKHLKGVIVFFGMSVAISVYTMLDTSMLGFLSNDTQVGYYTASIKLSHLILSMLTAITSVLLPRLTNYAKERNSSSFDELVSKSANILILLSVPMTFGLLILSKPLILLLSGENFVNAIPTMRLLTPLLIIISFGSLIGVQILPSLGKEKISFYSYIAGAISNITFNAIFIPKFGAFGAAIGTIIAETTVSMTQFIYTRKYILNKEFLVTVLESVFASLIMSILIYFLLHFIDSVPLQLLISFISGLIVYCIILYILKNKYFTTYFSKFINSIKK